MAADKEIMKAIETLRLDRPGRTHQHSLVNIVEGLTELAATFREEADLWAMSGAKGWKGNEAEKYLVAQHIDDVAAQLDNAGGGAALSVSDPQLHEVLNAQDDALEAELRESALRVDGVRDLAGLDKLIADSVAAGKGHVRDERPAHSDTGPTVAEIVAERDPAVRAAVDATFGPHERDGRTHTDAEPERRPLPGLGEPGLKVEIGGNDVTAYLSGAVDTLPGLQAALVPGSIPRQSEAGDPFAPATLGGVLSLVGQLDETLQPAPPYCRDCDLDQHRCYGCGEPVEHGRYACAQCELIHADGPPATLPPTWESDTMTADGLRPPGAPTSTAPLLGQPGDMSAGYSHTYVPPGGRVLAFAELLTPVPAASLPAHLSHSQGNTISDCATKYRLQRIENLPQVPQWANVGGSAFHAAVEAWERMADSVAGISLNEEDCELTWKHHFETEIGKVSAGSPVPISMWRAARKGAEGRAWWEVNGPLMLRRYLDARPADVTLEAAVGTSPVTFIEADLTVDVPTPYGPLPFNAKIDRVTFSEDGRTITIRDYKTSYERPTDTTQLGDYSWVLRTAVGGLAPMKILGTYFDARRGEWTAPVDLLTEHPFEAFQYRVTAAHGQKRALATGPTPARPSSYCGGCSVRYACPVMNQLKAVGR